MKNLLSDILYALGLLAAFVWIALIYCVVRALPLAIGLFILWTLFF